VIDADGRAVTPGFVDVHTHYDAQVFWDPLLTSSCWHGVTTLVMGNCGLAFAPCKPEHRESLMHIFSRVEGLDMETLQKGCRGRGQVFLKVVSEVAPPESRRYANVTRCSRLCCC
jgi:N-acyl-D-aspartate/D-glutamate deacylase